MLDQNTDRMWFVIGALVVGAGIILLANKVMPEIFAKVGRSFENIVESTVDEIKGAMKIPFSMDEIKFFMGTERERTEDDVFIFASDTSYWGGLKIPHQYFELGKSYSITFDIQKISGEVPGLGGHLVTTDHAEVLIDGVPATVWANGAKNAQNRNIWAKSVNYPNDNEWHHVEIKFTKEYLPGQYEGFDRDGKATTTDEAMYIQPNRAGGEADQIANGLVYKVAIKNIEYFELTGMSK